MTMRSDLADWCDWDEAALSYGIAIGIFDGANRRQVSRVLLSDNRLGNALHAGMLALVQGGVVERRTDPEEQFRWIFAGTTDMPGEDLIGLGMDLPDLGATPERAAPTRSAAPVPARRWWQRG